MKPSRQSRTGIRGVGCEIVFPSRFFDFRGVAGAPLRT